MEISTVTTDQLITHRTPHMGPDEIEKLAVDIRDNKLRHPVLLSNTTHTLIDGLNRVEAYKLLGWSVIPAIYTDDLTEITDYLEVIRDDEILEVRRISEMIKDIDPLIILRRDSRRHHHYSGGRTKGLPDVETSRDIYLRATGEKPGAIDMIRVVYRTAASGDPEAVKVVARLEAGQIGIYSAGAIIRKLREQRVGGVVHMSSRERRDVMDAAMRSLETTTDQVLKLGRLDDIPADEAEAHITMLLSHKSNIVRIIASLRGPRDS